MSKKVVRIKGEVFGLEDKDKLDNEHYYLPTKQAQHLVDCKVAEFAVGRAIPLSVKDTPPKKEPAKQSPKKASKKDEKDASNSSDAPNPDDDADQNNDGEE